MVIVAIGLAGIVLASFSAIETAGALGLGLSNTCFTSNCVDNFRTSFKGPLTILSATGELLIVISTVGGILIALQNYILTSRSSALSNHISHISIFTSYVDSEIARFERISASSVDALKWYNRVFFKSRQGLTDVSGWYVADMQELNKAIKKSNGQAKQAAAGSFRYKNHQARIIEALEPFGIDMEHRPRIDFFELEGDIFRLISTVNQTFCQDLSSLQLMSDRNYI